MIVIQKCKHKKKNIPLKGSSLILLHENCESKTICYEILETGNVVRRHKHTALPKIGFLAFLRKDPVEFQLLKVDNIELNELSAVKSALETNKQKIE